MRSDNSREQTQALIDSMNWHHSIDFGNGLTSKAHASLEQTNAFADALLGPLDLAEKSLLDIGAWNGAYSFEAKRRGAGRVVASDKFCWNHPAFRGRETFELGRRLTDLDIDAHEIDVPFITPDTVGVFDVVLFSGVFYHLFDPIHLTRQISACARDVLIVETHHDALDSAKPAMVFYPRSTLNGDGTNWWAPNPHCMYEMLKEFGFTEINYRSSPGFGGNSRGIYHAFRDRESMKKMGVKETSDPWLSLEISANRDSVFAPQ